MGVMGREERVVGRFSCGWREDGFFFSDGFFPTFFSNAARQEETEMVAKSKLPPVFLV